MNINNIGQNLFNNYTNLGFENVEQNIITFWNDINLKEQIIESRQNGTQWEFLDGPPFVNGTPHHGHLLVSTIKDTMARYMNQKGYKITYQIGFDCHGLPLEQEAEKTVGKVNPNDSIERLTEFNNQCRNIISNCSETWYETLGRLGRQFDKSQTYYTSDSKYMKALWWGFKQLWDNGLIYCSKKVMPYSPLCETPLSNFEANSNYQERTDTSIYVKFQIVNSDEKLLIWTTTPWSLFANQGICVNPNLTYCLIELNYRDYTDKIWICEDLINKFCIGEFSNYLILKKVIGSELKGIKYLPIFKIDNWDNYQVYADDYVQNNSGTGLVHLAPLFGEDDLRVMKLNNYTDNNIPDFIVDSQVKFLIDWNLGENNINGRFVIDTTTDIVIWLKTNNYALKSEKIKHSYPYCWRTDYPLIYLATDAWFMNVQKIIPNILENNNKINWYPSHVGTERFSNWIKDAPDWCLSRNRIWGTPIPIWTADNGDTICIGSIEELEYYTGQTINDIHLDKIHNCVFEYNNTKYYRTFGVLDCWFESGMAGLARFGYPECVNKSYPVDFIAESVDQTRGWFYTLNVLSTALNNQPAFKNVIVSGLILAADGKKMSKRLGNYTSPDLLIKKYGVDVFRLYLISSPASKAESFCFKDSELFEITKKILPYYNGHQLLNECIIYATTFFDNLNWIHTINSTNKLDIWIKNKFYEFAKEVYGHMEKLELTYIPNLIFKFIDNLTNLYIKLSRERLKNQLSHIDTQESIATLWNIMNNLNILLAPFLPHLAESFNILLFSMINSNSYKSIHLSNINIQSILDYELDTKLVNGFFSVNELLEAVRSVRQQISLPIYYPLESIILYTNSVDINEFIQIISSQLNIKKIEIKNINELLKNYKPNRTILGKIFKKQSNKYVQLIESGDINWDGCSPEYYTYDYNVVPIDGMVGTKFYYYDSLGKYTQSIVYININRSTDNDIYAEINNIRRQINSFRKDMGLKIYNKVDIIFEQNEYWNNINSEFIEILTNKLIANIKFSQELEDFKVIETFNGKKLKTSIQVI
jgi:isoleucyl-tRNA synthetase